MTTMYLVTGATGHLGSTVVQLLLSQNHRVRALVMPGDPNLPRLDPRVQVVTADLRDKQALLPLFAKQEKERRIVIHTAGLVSIGSDKDPRVRQINVEGTRNIVQLCQETGVERLVHVSSVHAIPEKPQGANDDRSRSF